MWIEDLTKALYFLNATHYKNSVCIDCIKDNVITFSSGKKYTVSGLARCYDKMIKTGEVKRINLD